MAESDFAEEIIVSFLMESGVKMLLKDLNLALNRGAKIRMLTGNYLGTIIRHVTDAIAY